MVPHLSISPSSSDADANLLEIFRGLALRKSELVAREGIRLRAFESEELPHFQALSLDKKREVIQQLSETLAVYEEMSSASLSLRDNPQLIWRSMSRIGMLPPGDIFDKITNEDIIVIFTPDQRQIFRNLEFLRHSILTVEELYTTEWYRYSKRDPLIVQKLRDLIGDILSGRKTGTFDPGIDEHVLEQQGSCGTAKLRLKIGHVAPITLAGKVVGIIVVERGWPED